jgi:hypothetical protein
MESAMGRRHERSLGTPMQEVLRDETMSDRPSLMISNRAFEPSVPLLSWDDYTAEAEDRWAKVLNDPEVTEDEVHRFLEANPSFLPFAAGHTLEGGAIRGHHGAVHGAVFSKPPLPGITRPVPDFLRVTSDSDGLHAIFFEIEDPSKPMAREDGALRAEYHQAIGQISEWQAWLAEPANILNFRALYRLDHLRRPRLDFRFCLIYGRRTVVESDRRTLQERSTIKPPFTESMTYDRLRASHDGRFDIAVNVVRERFEALSVPPTLDGHGPLARRYSVIEGKAEAAMLNDYLDLEQRRALAEALAAGDAWAAR